MNPAAILALISDLYLQVQALQQRVVELEAEAEKKNKKTSKEGNS